MEYVLGAIILAQQAFYMWNQHKLINKLMSRNYHEYRVTDKSQEYVKKVKIDDSQSWEIEDFRGLPESSI